MSKKSEQNLKEKSPDPGLPGRLSQRLDAYHSELLGRILTTLEIAVDDERKLKSLKDRVHEIQTWFWAKMKWRKDLGIIQAANDLNSKFVEEKPQDLEEFTHPFKAQIDEYVVWMLDPSKREETFATVLANLVKLAVPESKVQPLVKELNRLISLTSANLRQDLCHTVDYVLKKGRKQGKIKFCLRQFSEFDKFSQFAIIFYHSNFAFLKREKAPTVMPKMNCL